MAGMENLLLGAGTSQQSQRQCVERVGTQVTSCLLQLYAPSPPHSAKMDIIFVHGLQLDFQSDPHLSTWRTGDDSGELWPKSWLPCEYSKARILVASYDACIQTTATRGRQDLFSIAEMLFHDLLLARQEQARNRPVILVGHSFGGLVIKQLCLIAHAKKDDPSVNPLIQMVRGIFFYATPHRGMSGEFLNERGMGSISANEPLLILAKTLSTSAARLHEKFIDVKKNYEWKISGLGETCVPGGACNSVIVEEASSRFGDNFFLVQCDHFSICRPKDRESSSYLQLVELIRTACAKKGKGKRASSRIVGIDSLLSELTKHLEQHTFLGLWGMGGVGKTTMAELLFEELEEEFEYSCFVEQMKLISGSKADIKKKIWPNMRRYGNSIAKTCRWDDVRGTKLLMVLDDIDKHEHVDLILDIARDNAMRGSRYIVTSRDMGLLKSLDEPQYGKTHIREIPLLRNEDAERLFSSYAFSNGEIPPGTLGGIVREVVQACARLPLALKVLGTHLRAERDERRWAEIPSALKTSQAISTLEERIWAVLKVSYDALQIDEKELFLEVACTFSHDDHGFSREEVKWALACKYESFSNLLKTLEDRCLIKSRCLDDSWSVRLRRRKVGWEFQMHEHLRSMGCKIARDLGRSTDHFIYKLGEEDQSVLHQNISRQRIASLSSVVSLKYDDGECYPPRQVSLLQSIQAALPNMTGLHYLNLDFHASYISSSVEHVHDGIRRCFPDGILSLPASAVMVRFCGYGWGLNLKSEAFRFEKLVVLKLKIPENLPPDLLSGGVCERLPALKFLVVKCRSIDRLGGIGLEKLRELQHLCLRCQEYAGELPGNLGHLSFLEYLDLGYVSLPDTVGNWSKLEQLKTSESFNLVKLPETFVGNFSRVRHLEIKHCDSLVELPGTFGELTSLEHLEIICCRQLRILPETFGNLSNLEYLEIDSCHDLPILPDTFGNLSSLKHVVISYCSQLRKLPDTIGYLSRLQCLEMVKNERLSYLPDSFRSLISLEHLSIIKCVRLHDFLDMLLDLYKLKYLAVLHCPYILDMSSFPFRNLPTLEDLHLCSCWSPDEEEIRHNFSRRLIFDPWACSP